MHCNLSLSSLSMYLLKYKVLISLYWKTKEKNKREKSLKKAITEFDRCHMPRNHFKCRWLQVKAVQLIIQASGYCPKKKGVLSKVTNQNQGLLIPGQSQDDNESVNPVTSPNRWRSRDFLLVFPFVFWPSFSNLDPLILFFFKGDGACDLLICLHRRKHV